jgi:hypothetical protein
MRDHADSQVHDGYHAACQPLAMAKVLSLQQQDAVTAGKREKGERTWG